MSRQAKPSEWGKLSAGQVYSILANDFGRALFAAGLGHGELILLWHVLERSWGVVRTKRGRDHWPDAKPVMVNLNRLAVATGLPRQRIHEARNRLLSKRVLLETPDGLAINKEADSWIDPKTGGALLTPLQINYAEDARTRTLSTSEDVTPQRDKTPESVTLERDKLSRSSVTTHASTCHAPALHDVTRKRDKASRSSVTTPIEDRAHGFKTETEREASQPASQPRAIASNDTTPETGGVCHADCVRLARELFGESRAEAIERDPEGLSGQIQGRWDSLAHAIRKLHSENKPIRSLRGLSISATNRITREGPPVSVLPAGAGEDIETERARIKAEEDLITARLMEEGY